jgi:hypothetical protein
LWGRAGDGGSRDRRQGLVQAEGDRQAAEHTASQASVDPSNYEILIVDNNSSDATPDVIASCLRVRSVREPRQGLSHARNRAVCEARGEWIVFADDDMIFAPDWLSSWIGALKHGCADYAGGRILPEWGGAPPRWFRGEKLALIDGALGWFDLGPDVRSLADGDPAPFGGNMAVRRNLALRMNGFRADLGVNARNPGLGEETDFFLRARRAGAGGLYVGSALCRHRVPRERVTLTGLFRYGVASGLAHRAIVDPRARGSWSASLAFLLRGGGQLLKGRGDRFRQCVVNAGIEAGLARPGSTTPKAARTPAVPGASEGEQPCAR